ncbi:MAG TPA: HIT family protein [Thermomicrobiales bacterium]|jgi:histidine triad (HIT) family protein
MPTIFSRIISGEFPGRFVWRDERCVAFLTINPLRPGHTLVVPREEVDHWLDLDPVLAAHLMTVSQTIGQAIQRSFSSARVGLIIAGLEVPHTHLHLVPMEVVADLDFSRAERHPDPDALDQAAEAIRAALRAMGHGAYAEE